MTSLIQYPKKTRKMRYFNTDDGDIDIPDGDVEYGKSLYHTICLDCHRLTQNNL